MMLDAGRGLEDRGTKEGYITYSRRKVGFLAACAVLLAVVALLSLGIGNDLSLSEIVHYIFHPDGSWDSAIVWDLGLRLILAAVCAGAALGLAGAVMQCILRNQLASPFTLGLSNAAAFGASIGIIMIDAGAIAGVTSSSLGVSGTALTTVLAFVFAMIATGIMLLMVKVTDCTPEMIVLAGMAISAIFSAGLSFFQYTASDTALSSIVYWQFGSLGKVTWDQLWLMGIALVLVAAYLIYKRWDLNAMEAGEDVARGLGVNVRGTRVLTLVLSAVLTAIVVSFTGVIGFIGLMGPHIVKRLIGEDNRYVIVGSMIMGALVLLVSYLVGQYAFYTVIPVGIITSAIGGPLFIAILLHGRIRRSPA